MDIISVIVLLAIIGTAWWLFSTYVPAPAPVKQIGGVIVAVIMIIILVEALMGLGGLHNLRL